MAPVVKPWSSGAHTVGSVPCCSRSTRRGPPCRSASSLLHGGECAAKAATETAGALWGGAAALRTAAAIPLDEDGRGVVMMGMAGVGADSCPRIGNCKEDSLPSFHWLRKALTLSMPLLPTAPFRSFLCRMHQLLAWIVSSAAADLPPVKSLSKSLSSDSPPTPDFRPLVRL